MQRDGVPFKSRKGNRGGGTDFPKIFHEKGSTGFAHLSVEKKREGGGGKKSGTSLLSRCANQGFRKAIWGGRGGVKVLSSSDLLPLSGIGSDCRSISIFSACLGSPHPR